MAEQNTDTTTTPADTGAETSAEAVGQTDSPRKRVDRAVYNTRAAAEAAKPASDNYKLFSVSGPGGFSGFTWESTALGALANVAKHEGYTATSAGKPLSVDAVKSQLAQLSDEERAALLADLAPAGKGKKGK